MNILMRIIETWVFVAMVARAAVYIPVGILLGWLAFIVFQVSDGNAFCVLIGLWISYHAGNFLLAGLSGFAGRPSEREPSARDALRRKGMLGKR